MATREEMRKMTGQESGERTSFLKLNEVSMSGDTGKFKMRKVLSEKGADGKAPVVELGTELRGVILRSRWKLAKYIEDGDTGTYISSTEYDNKTSDVVTIFPSKDKGLAINMKAKYALSTLRILYFYLPEFDEIVRFSVKSSALTADKNPDPKNQLGLFEYIDSLNASDTVVNELITVCKGVHRQDPKGNRRKDYYATTFAEGPEIEDHAKMEQLTQEIWDKTTKPEQIEEPLASTNVEIAASDVSPDDLPF